MLLTASSPHTDALVISSDATVHDDRVTVPDAGAEFHALIALMSDLRQGIDDVDYWLRPLTNQHHTR